MINRFPTTVIKQMINICIKKTKKAIINQFYLNLFLSSVFCYLSTQLGKNTYSRIQIFSSIFIVYYITFSK
jgi:hypothetical protein